MPICAFPFRRVGTFVVFATFLFGAPGLAKWRLNNTPTLAFLFCFGAIRDFVLSRPWRVFVLGSTRNNAATKTRRSVP